MKPAGYYRYSSGMQREASIDDQIRHTNELCERYGLEPPTIYKDSAISGERHDRPGYKSLLADAQNGVFEVLVLWDLKRLSRAEDLPQVMACLKFWGIRVITCDGIDSNQDGSDIRTWVDGMMGNRNNKELAKNTHRGLTGQALAGYSAGGLPYGYKSVHDGNGFKRVIDEEQAKWVRFIFEHFAMGHSTRVIAGMLNEKRVPAPRGGAWAMSAIQGTKRGTGILGNPIYIGQQIWNRSKWVKDPSDNNKRKRFARPESEWIINNDPSLVIVEKATWDAVMARQKKLWNRKISTQTTGRGPKYLFSGLLKCGLCGCNYIIAGAYSYSCSGRLNRGASFCNNQSVSRHLVETVLLDGIKTEMLSESAFKAFEAETRRLLKNSQPDAGGARQSVQHATKEVENIMAAIRKGILTPTTKAALEEAEAKLAAAKANLAEIEAFKPTQVLPRARQIYRDLVDNLAKIDDIPRAREQIKAILGGEVRLVPEGDVLVAEIKGGFAALSQVRMVAGVGFGHCLTTTLKIPLFRRAPL